MSSFIRLDYVYIGEYYWNISSSKYQSYHYFVFLEDGLINLMFIFLFFFLIFNDNKESCSN